LQDETTRVLRLFQLCFQTVDLFICQTDKRQAYFSTEVFPPLLGRVYQQMHDLREGPERGFHTAASRLLAHILGGRGRRLRRIGRLEAVCRFTGSLLLQLHRPITTAQIRANSRERTAGEYFREDTSHDDSLIYRRGRFVFY